MERANGQMETLESFMAVHQIASIPALLAMSTSYQMIDPVQQSKQNPFPYTENIRGTNCKFEYNQVIHEYNSKPKNIPDAKKHAEDFVTGIGNWNIPNGIRYVNALITHMNNPDTQIIQGTYRNNEVGFHYYNPNTLLWVFVKVNGEFHCGWKLWPSQIQDLELHKNVS